MSAWITMISEEEADGAFKQALDFARKPHGMVVNVSAYILCGKHYDW